MTTTRTCVPEYLIQQLEAILGYHSGHSATHMLFTEGLHVQGRLIDVYIIPSDPNEKLIKDRVKAALRFTSDPVIVRQILEM